MFDSLLRIISPEKHKVQHHWIEHSSKRWFYVDIDGEILAEILTAGDVYHANGTRYITLEQAKQAVEREA